MHGLRRLLPFILPRGGVFDRVVLVHGFDSDVHAHWFDWLAGQVSGLERISLPDAGAPAAIAAVSELPGRGGHDGRLSAPSRPPRP